MISIFTTQEFPAQLSFIFVQSWFLSVDLWSLCSNIVLFQLTYDPFVQIWFCFNGNMISLFKFDFVLVDLWSLCSNLILFQWTYDLFVQIWFCFSGPMIPLFKYDFVSVDLWSLCSDLILFQWTYDPFVQIWFCFSGPMIPLSLIRINQESWIQWSLKLSENKIFLSFFCNWELEWICYMLIFISIEVKCALL